MKGNGIINYIKCSVKAAKAGKEWKTKFFLTRATIKKQ